MTKREHADYRLMLETAKAFMLQRNFSRVNREYLEIQEFLKGIDLRRRDAA